MSKTLLGVSKIVKVIFLLLLLLLGNEKSSIGKATFMFGIAVLGDQTFLFQPLHHHLISFPYAVRPLPPSFLQTSIVLRPHPQTGFFPKKCAGLSVGVGGCGGGGGGVGGEMKCEDGTSQSSAGVSHPRSLALPGRPSFNSQTTQEY